MNDGFDIQPTVSGLIMAKYCIGFNTMVAFTGIAGNEDMPALLQVFSKAQEFSDVKLRMTERGVLNYLNHNTGGAIIKYPMKGKIKTAPMKVNCLLQATLGSLTIKDYLLTQEAKKILRVAQRVAIGLLRYLQARKSDHYQALLQAHILARCTKIGLWDDSSYISKQIPGIGPVLSGHLVAAEKTSFQAIVEANPRELERIINRHPPLGNQIQEFVYSLPHTALSLSLTNNNGSNSTHINPDSRILMQESSSSQINSRSSQILVEITLLNQDTAVPPYELILLVGDSLNQVRMDYVVKACNLNGTESKYNLQIKIPQNEFLQIETIEAHLLNANFVGMNAYAKLHLVSTEAQTVLTKQTDSNTHSTNLKGISATNNISRKTNASKVHAKDVSKVKDGKDEINPFAKGTTERPTTSRKRKVKLDSISKYLSKNLKLSGKDTAREKQLKEIEHRLLQDDEDNEIQDAIGDGSNGYRTQLESHMPGTTETFAVSANFNAKNTVSIRSYHQQTMPSTTNDQNCFLDHLGQVVDQCQPSTSKKYYNGHPSPDRMSTFNTAQRYVDTYSPDSTELCDEPQGLYPTSGKLESSSNTRNQEIYQRSHSNINYCHEKPHSNSVYQENIYSSSDYNTQPYLNSSYEENVYKNFNGYSNGSGRKLFKQTSEEPPYHSPKGEKMSQKRSISSENNKIVSFCTNYQQFYENSPKRNVSETIGTQQRIPNKFPEAFEPRNEFGHIERNKNKYDLYHEVNNQRHETNSGNSDYNYDELEQIQTFIRDRTTEKTFDHYLNTDDVQDNDFENGGYDCSDRYEGTERSRKTNYEVSGDSNQKREYFDPTSNEKVYNTLDFAAMPTEHTGVENTTSCKNTEIIGVQNIDSEKSTDCVKTQKNDNILNLSITSNESDKLVIDFDRTNESHLESTVIENQRWNGNHNIVKNEQISEGISDDRLDGLSNIPTHRHVDEFSLDNVSNIKIDNYNYKRGNDTDQLTQMYLKTTGLQVMHEPNVKTVQSDVQISSTNSSHQQNYCTNPIIPDPGILEQSKNNMTRITSTSFDPTLTDIESNIGTLKSTASENVLENGTMRQDKTSDMVNTFENDLCPGRNENVESNFNLFEENKNGVNSKYINMCSDKKDHQVSEITDKEDQKTEFELVQKGPTSSDNEDPQNCMGNIVEVVLQETNSTKTPAGIVRESTEPKTSVDYLMDETVNTKNPIIESEKYSTENNQELVSHDQTMEYGQLNEEKSNDLVSRGDIMESKTNLIEDNRESIVQGQIIVEHEHCNHEEICHKYVQTPLIRKEEPVLQNNQKDTVRNKCDYYTALEIKNNLIRDHNNNITSSNETVNGSSSPSDFSQDENLIIVPTMKTPDEIDMHENKQGSHKPVYENVENQQDRGVKIYVVENGNSKANATNAISVSSESNQTTLEEISPTICENTENINKNDGNKHSGEVKKFPLVENKQDDLAYGNCMNTEIIVNDQSDSRNYDTRDISIENEPNKPKLTIGDQSIQSNPVPEGDTLRQPKTIMVMEELELPTECYAKNIACQTICNITNQKKKDDQNNQLEQSVNAQEHTVELDNDFHKHIQSLDNREPGENEQQFQKDIDPKPGKTYEPNEMNTILEDKANDNTINDGYPNQTYHQPNKYFKKSHEMTGKQENLILEDETEIFDTNLHDKLGSNGQQKVTIEKEEGLHNEPNELSQIQKLKWENKRKMKSLMLNQRMQLKKVRKPDKVKNHLKLTIQRIKKENKKRNNPIQKSNKTIKKQVNEIISSLENKVERNTESFTYEEKRFDRSNPEKIDSNIMEKSGEKPSVEWINDENNTEFNDLSRDKESNEVHGIPSCYDIDRDNSGYDSLISSGQKIKETLNLTQKRVEKAITERAQGTLEHLKNNERQKHNVHYKDIKSSTRNVSNHMAHCDKVERINNHNDFIEKLVISNDSVKHKGYRTGDLIEYTTDEIPSVLKHKTPLNLPRKIKNPTNLTPSISEDSKIQKNFFTAKQLTQKSGVESQRKYPSNDHTKDVEHVNIGILKRTDNVDKKDKSHNGRRLPLSDQIINEKKPDEGKTTYKVVEILTPSILKSEKTNSKLEESSESDRSSSPCKINQYVYEEQTSKTFNMMTSDVTRKPVTFNEMVLRTKALVEGTPKRRLHKETNPIDLDFIRNNVLKLNVATPKHSTQFLAANSNTNNRDDSFTEDIYYHKKRNVIASKKIVRNFDQNENDFMNKTSKGCSNIENTFGIKNKMDYEKQLNTQTFERKSIASNEQHGINIEEKFKRAATKTQHKMPPIVQKYGKSLMVSNIEKSPDPSERRSHQILGKKAQNEIIEENMNYSSIKNRTMGKYYEQESEDSEDVDNDLMNKSDMSVETENSDRSNKTTNLKGDGKTSKLKILNSTQNQIKVDQGYNTMFYLKRTPNREKIGGKRMINEDSRIVTRTRIYEHNEQPATSDRQIKHFNSDNEEPNDICIHRLNISSNVNEIDSLTHQYGTYKTMNPTEKDMRPIFSQNNQYLNQNKMSAESERTALCAVKNMHNIEDESNPIAEDVFLGTRYSNNYESNYFDNSAIPAGLSKQNTLNSTNKINEKSLFLRRSDLENSNAITSNRVSENTHGQFIQENTHESRSTSNVSVEKDNSNSFKERKKFNLSTERVKEISPAITTHNPYNDAMGTREYLTISTGKTKEGIIEYKTSQSLITLNSTNTSVGKNDGTKWVAKEPIEKPEEILPRIEKRLKMNMPISYENLMNDPFCRNTNTNLNWKSNRNSNCSTHQENIAQAHEFETVTDKDQIGEPATQYLNNIQNKLIDNQFKTNTTNNYLQQINEKVSNDLQSTNRAQNWRETPSVNEKLPNNFNINEYKAQLPNKYNIDRRQNITTYDNDKNHNQNNEYNIYTSSQFQSTNTSNNSLRTEDHRDQDVYKNTNEHVNISKKVAQTLAHKMSQIRNDHGHNLNARIPTPKGTSVIESDELDPVGNICMSCYNYNTNCTCRDGNDNQNFHARISDKDFMNLSENRRSQATPFQSGNIGARVSDHREFVSNKFNNWSQYNNHEIMTPMPCNQSPIQSNGNIRSDDGSMYKLHNTVNLLKPVFSLNANENEVPNSSGGRDYDCLSNMRNDPQSISGNGGFGSDINGQRNVSNVNVIQNNNIGSTQQYGQHFNNTIQYSIVKNNLPDRLHNESEAMFRSNNQIQDIHNRGGNSSYLATSNQSPRNPYARSDPSADLNVSNRQMKRSSLERFSDSPIMRYEPTEEFQEKQQHFYGTYGNDKPKIRQNNKINTGEAIINRGEYTLSQRGIGVQVTNNDQYNEEQEPVSSSTNNTFMQGGFSRKSQGEIGRYNLINLGNVQSAYLDRNKIMGIMNRVRHNIGRYGLEEPTDDTEGFEEYSERSLEYQGSRQYTQQTGNQYEALPDYQKFRGYVSGIGDENNDYNLKQHELNHYKRCVSTHQNPDYILTTKESVDTAFSGMKRTNSDLPMNMNWNTHGFPDVNVLNNSNAENDEIRSINASNGNQALPRNVSNLDPIRNIENIVENANRYLGFSQHARNYNRSLNKNHWTDQIRLQHLTQQENARHPKPLNAYPDLRESPQEHNNQSTMHKQVSNFQSKSPRTSQIQQNTQRSVQPRTFNEETIEPRTSQNRRDRQNPEYRPIEQHYHAQNHGSQTNFQTKLKQPQMNFQSKLTLFKYEEPKKMSIDDHISELEGTKEFADVAELENVRTDRIANLERSYSSDYERFQEGVRNTSSPFHFEE
ncbi:hypothetical protein WDU94_006182 [Cyamophila willieti]